MTFHVGSICIINIEKTYIIYKNKKYYFYRVYYIQDDYIKIVLSKEDDSTRYYDADCPIIVKFFYPTFIEFKKNLNIDNQTYIKIISKMVNKKAYLVSKKELNSLFQKFTDIVHAEDRKYNNFDLPND